MLNFKVLTKIQSVALVAVIVFASIGGVAIYVLLGGQEPSSETIKIGILADIDEYWGKRTWQSAVLAAEHVNAEGGILGRQIEVIAADSVSGVGTDVAEVTLALAKLISNDQVDFIIGGALSGDSIFACQEVIAEQKKIFFCGPTDDEFTQRVLDDYDKYKYYFNFQLNASSIFRGMTTYLLFCREMTGFNKVGYLGLDTDFAKGIMEGLDHFLPDNGFDLVYKGAYPMGTVDFSSYFAAAESAGVEIMVPLIISGAVPVVKEYHDRQSPLVIYDGILAEIGNPESWVITDGKCNYVTVSVNAVTAGYPLTNKTLPAREAYIDRWGEYPAGLVVYDICRFILPDAIERAGTIETDAVIEALEETNIETSGSRNFAFTKSHSRMISEDPNDPDADYSPYTLFQWQNGEQVPVYPKKIMEKARATYIYPPWPGPWD
ncbi:MAG: ABC transporter substrate-binding protein [Candidatus Bathyarchaeum sp.]|nr:MAG: ABC transporter substrate-binding protein [Candidatus Bathyarchaeum sp.]